MILYICYRLSQPIQQLKPDSNLLINLLWKLTIRIIVTCVLDNVQSSAVPRHNLKKCTF